MNKKVQGPYRGNSSVVAKKHPQLEDGQRANPGDCKETNPFNTEGGA